MKTYIDHKETVVFENNWIPKDPSNTDYAQFLQELEKGEAELIPYVPPAPTWEQIRSQRDAFLKDSDWAAFPDANPKPSKEAWLSYRQALRNVPQTFSTPEEVAWPNKPE
jgi:hypothetical protein